MRETHLLKEDNNGTIATLNYNKLNGNLHNSSLSEKNCHIPDFVQDIFRNNGGLNLFNG